MDSQHYAHFLRCPKYFNLRSLRRLPQMRYRWNPLGLSYKLHLLLALYPNFLLFPFPLYQLSTHSNTFISVTCALRLLYRWNSLGLRNTLYTDFQHFITTFYFIFYLWGIVGLPLDAFNVPNFQQNRDHYNNINQKKVPAYLFSEQISMFQKEIALAVINFPPELQETLVLCFHHLFNIISPRGIVGDGFHSSLNSCISFCKSRRSECAKDIHPI